MALWSRLRQLKLNVNLLHNNFIRCYSLNHGSSIANQYIPSSCSRSLVPFLNHHPSNLVTQTSTQLEFFNKVRFFASKNTKNSKSVKKNKRAHAKPAQPSQQKKEEKEASEPNLNEQITAQFLRLVTDEGHAVVSRFEALSLAKSLKMDLVEVDKNAKPPVCKILDYNKEKYLRESKEKERAKSKSTLMKEGYKTVKVAAKISQQDLEMKANLVKRQVESGYRVKCTAVEAANDSKKKESTNDLELKTLLSRFIELIKDVVNMESEIQVEKTQAFVFVRHVKFSVKKGSVKKTSETGLSSLSGTQSSENPETGPSKPKELLDETKTSEWTVSDGIERVFDINDEVSSPSADRIPINAAEPVMANRYARDPRAGIPSRDINRHGARNTIDSVPQIPNRMRPRDSSHPSSHNSAPKSYGVFGGQRMDPTTPVEENGTTESNRYKRNDTSHSARGVSPPIFNREAFQRR